MKKFFKFPVICACCISILSSCVANSPEVKKGDEVNSYEVVLEKDISSIDIIRQKNKYEYKICGHPSKIVTNVELKRETRLAVENAPLVIIGSIATLGILTPLLMPTLAGDQYVASGEQIESIIPLESQKCESAPCLNADTIIRISNYNIAEKKQVEGLEYIDHLNNAEFTIHEKLNINGELDKKDTQLLKIFWERKKYLPQGIMISVEVQPELKTQDTGDNENKLISKSELKVKIPKSKFFIDAYVDQNFVRLSQQLLMVEMENSEFKKAYTARFNDSFSKILSREPAKGSDFNEKAAFSKYLLETRTRLYKKNKTNIQEKTIKDQFFGYYEKRILTEVEQGLYNTILEKRQTPAIETYKALFNLSTISNDMHTSLKPHFQKIEEIEKSIINGENGEGSN